MDSKEDWEFDKWFSKRNLKSWKSAEDALRINFIFRSDRFRKNPRSTDWSACWIKEDGICEIEDPVSIPYGSTSRRSARKSATVLRRLAQILRRTDVIMVGKSWRESRLVTCALTAHIVLSTLHTNPRWELFRLIDMGVGRSWFPRHYGGNFPAADPHALQNAGKKTAAQRENKKYILIFITACPTT